MWEICHIMKLNIGSFICVVKQPDWLNVDLLPLWDDAIKNGYNFVRHDLRHRFWMFADESIEAINASHVLEHVTYGEGLLFLADCHRMLKKGGVIRIAVPDLETLALFYSKKEMAKFDAINEPASQLPTQAQKFWMILTAEHAAAYDFETLLDAGLKAGFKKENITQWQAQHGSSEVLNHIKDVYPELSVYVEMKKA